MIYPEAASTPRGTFLMRIASKFLIGLLLLAIAAGGGYWVLITPGNPFTRLFQRKIADIEAPIVIGPYPVERDFRLLKDNKVRLIVSLLDPALPYEKTLLERERKLAATYGMRMVNFPMSSILGKKFGGYYNDSASRAADLIAKSHDKLYLHCYLGLHRIQVVRDLLAARGVQSGMYTVRQAERDQPRRLLDAAEASFQGRRYDEALASLALIPSAELSTPARLLLAWVHLQAGHLEVATRLFADLQPVAGIDATVGLGYCALRAGDAAMAERHFLRAVETAPSNAEALGGLGLAYFRAGRLTEAAQKLEASLRLAPDNQELKDVLAKIQPKPAN